jgi:uncharacterized protein YndB with AHSA1/START domain
MSRTTGPRISEEAVTAATGKGWSEWFAILDAAGGAQRNHREIVALLGSHADLSAWWRQSITVEYEKARGLRETHQQPGGYRVGGSRTIRVPVATLFEAWADDGRRARWLPEPITIRRSTPARSLRITWSDGASSVNVDLYSKGDARSQVSVEHGKLPDADTAARMKAFWSEALDRLRNDLEREDPVP